VRNVRPVEWQEDSAYLHLSTSAWDFSDPRGTDKRYTNLVGNLPWVMHNAWWQYRHSMDDAMLRDTIYPLLRRSVNLYLHLLRETPDGRLSMVPTYSPETHETADCAFDLALCCAGDVGVCCRLPSGSGSTIPCAPAGRMSSPGWWISPRMIAASALGAIIRHPMGTVTFLTA